MKFKCSFCGTKGNIGTTAFKKMMAFQWYKDDKGMIHTGVVCSECWSISDCLISFLKVPLIPFGVAPYKVVFIFDLITWLGELMQHKKNLEINCMESAVYAMGIPEDFIEKMKAYEVLGSGFEEPIGITAADYDMKKSIWISNNILKKFGDETQ